MRFTRRDMKILEYLKNYEMVDLDSMADYLEISVKSLKNQLKELSEAIHDFEISFRFCRVIR
ncbi:MAG: helix-turn-helix domain-containing protein [Clostridiales bacterium]|nr:helix-turn-helix domain-containing protein [Clostridiales bacterium]